MQHDPTQTSDVIHDANSDQTLPAVGAVTLQDVPPPPPLTPDNMATTSVATQSQDLPAAPVVVAPPQAQPVAPVVAAPPQVQPETPVVAAPPQAQPVAPVVPQAQPAAPVIAVPPQVQPEVTVPGTTSSQPEAPVVNANIGTIRDAVKQKIETEYGKKDKKKGFWHRHGNTGLDRAADFVKALDEATTGQGLFDVIMAALNNKKGNEHAHSLKPMIALAVVEVANIGLTNQDTAAPGSKKGASKEAHKQNLAEIENGLRSALQLPAPAAPAPQPAAPGVSNS